jgi:putative ABC transport system permease protein
MWRNYLTVGIRALARSRTYAFINIFGLALGLAACLLILLYVRYEHSYDSWMQTLSALSSSRPSTRQPKAAGRR